MLFESLQRNSEKPILDGLTTTKQDFLLHAPTECGASSEDVLSLLEMYLPIFDKAFLFVLFVNDNFNGLKVHHGSKSKPEDQHSFWRPSNRIISVNTGTVDEPERGRYKNWGVTNWDLRRWGFRQVYAVEARDGTKTRFERAERGPQGLRCVKVMDEWTQTDIRRECRRKKSAAKKRRERKAQTRRSGETILV
jgi:hypothetical protein